MHWTAKHGSARVSIVTETPSGSVYRVKGIRKGCRGEQRLTAVRNRYQTLDCRARGGNALTRAQLELQLWRDAATARNTALRL